MKLKKHKFGRTGLRVSELCLSTSNFARYADLDESFALLDAFREVGGNLVQTSGICPGVNLGDGLMGLPEELLGRWLRERKIKRERVTIATRIALTRPVIGGVQTYTELIRRCAEDSIRRIGCEFLDLLVIEWSEAILPTAESVAAFEAVIASGAVRHIVPANFPSWRVLECLAATRLPLHALAGLETDYSLAMRTSFEGGAAKLAADHELPVIARAPLAGGHLAQRGLTPQPGAPRDRTAGDRYAAIGADGIWPMLSATAKARHRTPAQVALAWVLSHPQVTSVLISVRSRSQLHELLGAAELELSDDDLARLGTFATRRASSAVPTTV